MQQNVIPWQEGLYLAGYEVLSDTWIWADTLEYAEGFGLGSSTYDHWEDDYVFLGLPSEVWAHFSGWSTLWTA